jgi:hypothetical protein
MSDITQANVPASTVTLLASAARTATASGAGVAGFAAANNLVLQLQVTAAAGIGVTLDVVVQDTVDGTNYSTIATFAQAVSATREVIRLATPFTGTLRAVYTIGGADPSLTFSVLAYADI